MAFAEVDPADLPTRPGVSDDLSVPAACEGLVRPGEMLNQYRILARLGSGGMGEVFKAIHTTMNRIVALKVLAPKRLDDARALARFEREVRSAGRLSHPNIVTFFDAEQDRGLSYLAMEYVDGIDLAHCMASFGPPPVPIACEIIRQAALGLQHAHERGMIHRDIKPANLMVVRPQAAANAPGWPVNPLVKVLDFGLARLLVTEESVTESDRPLTREGTVIGTPEFMSPEQASDSRRVDIRTDIYSLGCTLYYLLAGRPPFVNTSLFEVLACQMKEPPPPLQRVRPDLHPGLAAVINRALAKRPEDRFQTPDELARALQPWSQPTATASSAATTIDLDALALPALYRETPRSGTHHPTLPGVTLTRSVARLGFLLGMMITALTLFCLTLLVFRTEVAELLLREKLSPPSVPDPPALTIPAEQQQLPD